MGGSFLAVILAGLFSIWQWGYVYSIDFVGGTNLEYKLSKQVTRNQIEKVLAKDKVEAISLSVKENTVDVRTKPLDEKKEALLRKHIKEQTKSNVTLQRFETVGPTIGKETIYKTLWAVLFGVVAILVYMSFAFKGWTFAFAAIVALLHDLIVLLGVYSLVSHFFGAQLDTLFVTAMLTTMSFSVHDTIIIFDKIREYVRIEGRDANPVEMANRALTETMVRSLNNSMTITFVLLALMLIGGATIKFFAAALLIGTITGTYSSPFVATPIYILLAKRRVK